MRAREGARILRRDLELMELIAAADAVLKARVDPEDAEDWLAHPFS
jgi:hypothetical protein